MADEVSRDTLITRKNAIQSQLHTMVTAPQPSYTVGSESFSWNQYQAMLMKQLAMVNEELQATWLDEGVMIYDDPNL